MKKLMALVLAFVCVLSLFACAQQGQSDTTNQTQPPDTEAHIDPPYDALLNLEVWNGKFTFQRIATTPCIVYSNSPINDMSQGTRYTDRDDILTTIIMATDKKTAITDTLECGFSHYIYMYDHECEATPWHYRFAICDCGTVMITNNNELLCTIKLTDEEIQSVLTPFEGYKKVVKAGPLLRNGAVIGVSVSSRPEGYNYSFNGKGIDAVIEYLSTLNLESTFDENPNEYYGMTWVISLKYEDGDDLEVYHFGNIFIKSSNSPWYKMSREEAARFDELLEEIK